MYLPVPWSRMQHTKTRDLIFDFLIWATVQYMGMVNTSMSNVACTQFQPSRIHFRTETKFYKLDGTHCHSNTHANQLGSLVVLLQDCVVKGIAPRVKLLKIHHWQHPVCCEDRVAWCLMILIQLLPYCAHDDRIFTYSYDEMHDKSLIVGSIDS